MRTMHAAEWIWEIFVCICTVPRMSNIHMYIYVPLLLSLLHVMPEPWGVYVYGLCCHKQLDHTGHVSHCVFISVQTILYIHVVPFYFCIGYTVFEVFATVDNMGSFGSNSCIW